MLECVVNISEGRHVDVVAAIAAAADDALLDIHSDSHHNRSVLTLAGPDVEEAAVAVAAESVARLDLTTHAGVHPRLGVVDVVPFVPLGESGIGTAIEARDRVATRLAEDLHVPCFLYGPERTLPEVRRRAWHDLEPDAGPGHPHPTAGAVCVGARPVLVAYNLWLAPPATVDDARAVAAAIRSPAVRTLGFDLDGAVQVSCNLVDPLTVGPDVVYDAVAARAVVAHAELVGLVPAAVLATIDADRWDELDLAPSRTIEARLREAGLDGGRFDYGA